MVVAVLVGFVGFVGPGGGDVRGGSVRGGVCGGGGGGVQVT